MLMMAKMASLMVASKAGGVVFPEVTLTSANLGSSRYGYVKPGSYFATLFSSSGGALSSTTLPDYETDAVVKSLSTIYVNFPGDVRSQVAGVTALKVNGTPYALYNPATYASGNTYLEFEPGFAAAGTYTIQLV